MRLLRETLPIVLVVSVFAWAMSADPPRVTIDVTPRVVLENGTVRLTCRVPRDDFNRQLEYGVEGYRLSRYDLEGARARVTWEAFVDHLPCDVGPAYCAVRTADGRWTRVSMDVYVSGC